MISIKAMADAVLKALGRCPVLVDVAAKRAMEDAGKRAAERMRAELRAHKKVDTRQLLDSIGYTIIGGRGQHTLYVGPGVKTGGQTVAPYKLVIEYGRRPGARMPPAAPIAAWMARHGIEPKMLFPIRRAIGERGLAGQPFPYIEPGGRELEQYGGTMLANGVWEATESAFR